jgi:hypothetical protein
MIQKKIELTLTVFTLSVIVLSACATVYNLNGTLYILKDQKLQSTY